MSVVVEFGAVVCWQTFRLDQFDSQTSGINSASTSIKSKYGRRRVTLTFL